MAEHLGVEPGIYQKKRSYARSYNLSRFYETDEQQDTIESTVFEHTLEEAFESLNLTTEEEQLAFLEFMYSIEITQTDPDDHWAYYEAQTGLTPTDDEKNGIRMDIRTDAVKYLTSSFFENLTDAVHDGAVTDLDTVFYLLRLWEIDTFGHLNYTELVSLEHAEDFILWYDEVQSTLLEAIAESSGIDPDEIQTMYAGYTLRSETESGETADNCDLSGISPYMQEYIISAKTAYSTAKFSRIRDVAEWLRA